MQRALDIINVDKKITASTMCIRFDVHRDILTKYYKDRMLQDMAANKPPTPVSEKLLINWRAFQRFINRTFAPCVEDISLTSTAASFPLGGGIIRKAPHDSFLRFEWSLPQAKGKTLLRMVLGHQWALDGFLAARDLDNLRGGKLFQLQASREHVKESPDMDGQECLSILQKSTYGKPRYTSIHGSTLRNKISFLAKLDPSNVPCGSGRNPVQSISWQLFNNDGLIMFYRPEAQLVRFWSQSTTSSPRSAVPSLTPINTTTWTTPGRPMQIPLWYAYRFRNACCMRKCSPPYLVLLKTSRKYHTPTTKGWCFVVLSLRISRTCTRICTRRLFRYLHGPKCTEKRRTTQTD